jgi:hypothetical protein
MNVGTTWPQRGHNLGDKMQTSLISAQKHFETALKNVKANDFLTAEFIRGLINLTKFMEHVNDVLEQIDASTR